MSWFDIIILLILLGAFIKGIKKGLAMQLAGLAAIVIGAIFAGKAASLILPFIIKTVDLSIRLARVISYISAFIVIVFAINFLGKMIHTVIEALHISFLNKIFGAIIGVITSLIILSIIINLVVMLDPEEDLVTKNIKTESLFYYSIESVVPAIVPYLNEDLREKYIPDQFKQENQKQEQNGDPNLLVLSINQTTQIYKSHYTY